MKDLYTENCKTWLKKNKDLNKCKDIPCSWIERFKYQDVILL